MVSRVILHPSVSHFVRFISTMLGRDKLMRVLQYYSRLRIWHLGEQNGPTIPKERWKRFMRQLVLTRKLLRVGKSVEHIQIAAKGITTEAITSDHDSFLHHISVLRQLLLAAYLTFDNATILDSLGLYAWKGARRIQVQAARLWLSTVLCGLITQLYCLYRLSQNEKSTREGADAKAHVPFKRVASKLQLLSGLCDLGISSSAAGLTHLNEGLIGICGIVSSIVGVYGQFKATS